MEFDELWNRAMPFDLSEEVPGCVYAARFAEWVATLCAPLRESPGLVAINQAKILLVDAYFSWRVAVPKAHRHLVREQGHRCIWHVFEETYQALKSAELVLAPPPLSLPLAPKRSRKAKEVAPQPDFYIPEEEDDA